ncbi:MAG: hypothetical protein IPG44_13705 [Anaerolineales bacterium]|jgi:hypothetical protein|nr:hypothetical protein [Chloroflexota bacterium]MBK6646775.1 hypothetical protein [Anaerolineales bacterium]MCC6985646.1 hypothetical protein [Anaerolineales bacterium]
MSDARTSHSQKPALQSLETHLSRTLKRVPPPSGMVERLRSRVQMPTRSEITLRLSDWRRLFYVFGGVLSGMLILVTIARAFYYFAGRGRTSL